MGSSPRSYTPLLKILREGRREEEQCGAVRTMSQAGGGSESRGGNEGESWGGGSGA